MKRQTINMFVEHVVKKPMPYILFLIVGCGLFVLTTIKTTVPVYVRYAGNISRSGSVCEIEFHDEQLALPQSSHIYICIDDSQRLFELHSFEPTERGIAFPADQVPELQSGEVYLDVEAERVPLYKMLFKQGGLYDGKR